MEQRVDTPVVPTGIVEIDRIGSAITRLGGVLHENAARRKALEERLRQADRLAVLGRMVAGVAHEVRNPLASIKLKLQLAANGTPSAERVADAFQVIEAEVDRLDRLVQRLLTLGRPADPVRHPTALTPFLAERLSRWEAQAMAQGTQLVVGSGEHDGEAVALDRDQLGQILDNLMANALEAVAGGDGAVRVEIERPSRDEVIIAVADDGPGVPAGLAQHVFEPFVTTKAGGTGLGLFLSAELARRLGGELRHVEPPEGGARFEVRLPC